MRLTGRHAGRAIAVLAIGAALASAAPLAQAAGEAPGIKNATRGAFTYFDYQVAPGQTTAGAAILTNVSTTAADYTTYAVDAYTSPQSGIVFRDKSVPISGDAAWITMKTKTLHLNPGQSGTLDFTVSAPPGAAPGDHVAGIAGENASSSERPGQQQGTALNVTERSILAVVVHVPGLSQVGFTTGAATLRTENGNRQIIDVPMQSTSNILLKPVVDLTVKTCAGAPVTAVAARQLDTFTAMAAITYPYYLDGIILKTGCYQLQVTTSYQGRQLDTHASQITVTGAEAAIGPNAPPRRPTAGNPSRFSVPTWAWVVGAIGLWLLLILLLVLLVRRRGRKEKLALRDARRRRPDPLAGRSQR